MSKKKPTAFENIRLVGVHKEPTFALGEAVSKGICKKCKSKDNYNFVINNGLCNSCIAERLDELDTADKHIGWLKDDKVRLNKSIKLRDNAFDALIDMNEKNEKQLRAELTTANAENKRLRDQIKNTRFEVLDRTISRLTQTISNLSVRHHPPHQTIRDFQKELSKAIQSLKGK